MLLPFFRRSPVPSWSLAWVFAASFLVSLAGCNAMSSGGPIGNKPNISPFLGDNASPATAGGGYGKQNSTGTVVGERVMRLRGDLSTMQANLTNHNETLLTIRQDTVSQAQVYHGVVAAINARLQIGTTPGNPVLVQQWNQAQQQLELVSTASGKMSNLANAVSSDGSFSSYLLDSVRSTYALAGGIDEDHRQLAILEDEVNRTMVLIERLVREIRADIDRQTAYVARERGYLSSLSTAISKGSFSGNSAAPGMLNTGLGLGSAGNPGSLSAPSAGLSGGVSFPNPAFAPVGNTLSAPLPPVSSLPSARKSGDGSGKALASTASGGSPFVIIRFDRAKIAYEAELQNSVSNILQRSPSASFEVLAIAPDKKGGSNTLASALKQAIGVKQSLVRYGVSPSRISIASKVSKSTQYNEVHVFAS
ncbi:MAG: hypothetical protein ACK5GA_01825 [Holosporaceae bacterium]